MMSESALKHCCEHAEALRTAVNSAEEDPGWAFPAEEALGALHAQETELAKAITGKAADRPVIQSILPPRSDRSGQEQSTPA